MPTPEQNPVTLSDPIEQAKKVDPNVDGHFPCSVCGNVFTSSDKYRNHRHANVTMPTEIEYAKYAKAPPI